MTRAVNMEMQAIILCGRLTETGEGKTGGVGGS
jgi:hypothetical protein